MSMASHPKFYRKFGTTKSGDPRHQCKLCQKTFSIGRPARRHRRCDKNGMILKMLVNGVPLSKICVVGKVSYHDVYRKIDFIHQQVAVFVSCRERFDSIDFGAVGSRFATESQTLSINWPTRRERTPVMVQHLCTAHARSGYIMEAAIQFDPSLTLQEVESKMQAVGDFAQPQAFRENARLWSKAEFEEYLQRLKRTRAITNTDLYQLPHTGALVRYDILQFAHARRLRAMLSATDAPLVLVIDDDRGLRAAFAAAFVEEVAAQRG